MKLISTDNKSERAILNPFCGFLDVRLLFILFVYSQMIINIYEMNEREFLCEPVLI